MMLKFKENGKATANGGRELDGAGVQAVMCSEMFGDDIVFI